MSGQLARQQSGLDQLVEKSINFFNYVFDGTTVVPFSVRFWNDHEWQHGTAPPRFTLELKHPGTMRRLFWRPTELSLGESFIYDDFDIQGDVEASFKLGDYLLARNWLMAERLSLGKILLSFPGRQSDETWRSAARLNGRIHSKKRDAAAIRYHYNVSNDFYRLWLDQRMIYSCAYFHSPADSLNDAQYRKLDYLCRKLRLKPGETLLDVGCGWGGLIMHAVEKYGINALGITLSKPQAELANMLIKQAGLGDRCRVEVYDYRDIPSRYRFDKIVSVGMFEHVGGKNLPDYFEQAYSLLNYNGAFLNHGITESAHRGLPNGSTFIDRYVFPDGELVPLLQLAEQSGFEVCDVESLREHYAMTLRHWVKRLEVHKEKAIALTCPVTYRIWRIYMAGSAYNFETGQMGLYQTLLVKSGRQSRELPLTRCDWYRPCPNGHH